MVDARYWQRPEVIESIFYMWRATHDQRWCARPPPPLLWLGAAVLGAEEPAAPGTPAVRIRLRSMLATPASLPQARLRLGHVVRH